MHAGAEQSVLSSDFRRLFDEEFGYVCRVLRRLGVREADLKDVAQELFVTLHKQLPDYDRSRPIKPWIFSFVVRFAANYRRLARHQSVAFEREFASPERDTAFEARDLILRALSQLDFDRRVVVVMHDLEGWGAPEIAEQLKLPVNTVYSRIRLARDDFRRAVATLQSKGSA